VVFIRNLTNLFCGVYYLQRIEINSFLPVIFMKRMGLLFAVVFGVCCASAQEADFYLCSKISAVAGMALVKTPDMVHFYFKILPGEQKEIEHASIYLSTDRDPKTGRKNYGCEYYMNAKKRSLTYYNKDGRETGFRKAFTVRHIDDWCIWSFKSSVFAATPLDDIFLTWKGIKKQGHIRLAPGKAIRKVIIPVITTP